jgi:hypothetical protein
MIKNILIGIGILLLVIATIIASQTIFKDNKDVENMDYKTERIPIENRFPDIPNFVECYWKSDTIGKANFGPTNYWMRGFIILEEGALQKISSEYEWSATNIDFPVGIAPNVTGKTDFSWHFNKDFQLLVLRQKFIGYIFLDITNGIIYFDVENT